MTRWAVLGLMALAVLPGCGGGDDGTGGSPQDRARAAELLSFYRDSGQAEQWSIESVKVDGGDVTVVTGLAPDASKEAEFEEPCATLVGIYSWIESIAVEGSDGEDHVSWAKGDAGCEVKGLG